MYLTQNVNYIKHNASEEQVGIQSHMRMGTNSLHLNGKLTLAYSYKFYFLMLDFTLNMCFKPIKELS
jgi:hypothetical protein